jgi:Ca2+-binding RTX toxin-like protein
MSSTKRRIAAVATVVGALAAGPAAADRIRGSDGGETINGTAGRDTILARGGDDTVNGLAGRDRIRAGLGDDTVSGNSGRDLIFIADVGDVRELGDDDGDTANGGTGRDRILARDGEEDQVDCGPGRDRARVDQFDDVSNCERTRRRSVTAAGLARRKAVACRARGGVVRDHGDEDRCEGARDRDDDDGGNSGPG